MDKCRICNYKLGQPFLDLGNSPLANSYLKKEDLGKMEPYYPLAVYLCNSCYLVQIEEVCPAEEIFSHGYAYFSSYSKSWLEHSYKYTEMITRRFAISKDKLVVEIGSNDGYLLQYFKRKHLSVLGIDSASDVARKAEKRGIPTEVVYFTSRFAEEMRGKGKVADLIIANNVLAHNPDLNDFVEGLKIMLKPNGLITIEFPHLLKLLNYSQFDTIYHEHFSYFSFHSVRNLLERHKLQVFDIEELPTHGGSLRIYVKHTSDSSKKISRSVFELLEKEEKKGILERKIYVKFKDKVEKIKRDFLKLLIREKTKNKVIVGYGAPAKANTLLNYCGVRTDFIDYTVDKNPYKQDKFLPGTHIPIKHPDIIKLDKPDYICILPWNLKEEIIKQLSYISNWGGRFIVPIPQVELI